MTRKTTITYHPSFPEAMELAFDDEYLQSLYQQGYRLVNLKRIGRILRKARHKSGVGIPAFLEYLTKYEITISADTLGKIERADLGYSAVTIKIIKNLAKALGMPLANLVRPQKGLRIKKPTVPKPTVKHGSVSYAASRAAKGITYKVRFTLGTETYEAAWIAENPDSLQELVKTRYPSSNVTEITPCYGDGLVVLTLV